MSRKSNLHPSVQQFKAFVKRHPLLIQEVRSKQKTWQELFEEWSILGEEHEEWQQFKKPQRKTESIVQTKQVEKENISTEESNETGNDSLVNLLGMLKNINFSDLQQHMSQFSGLLSNVQTIMQAFGGNQQQQQQQQPQHPPHQGGDPFSFRQH